LRPTPGEPKATAGPLWTGLLGDASFVRRVLAAGREHGHVSAEATKLLERLEEEATAPALYFEVDDFTRATKQNAPRMPALLEGLRALGHVAVRTHFSDRGFKTDAPPQTILGLLLAPRP
jgi:tRNA G26 N,N-dimethylase Trm1